MRRLVPTRVPVHCGHKKTRKRTPPNVPFGLKHVLSARHPKGGLRAHAEAGPVPPRVYRGLHVHPGPKLRVGVSASTGVCRPSPGTRPEVQPKRALRDLGSCLILFVSPGVRRRWAGLLRGRRRTSAPVFPETSGTRSGLRPQDPSPRPLEGPRNLPRLIL